MINVEYKNYDYGFIHRRRRRFWKGIHSGSDTSRTGAEGLFFYYPRMLYCPDPILAVMLSQHWVSSSKALRPRAPCGARCVGHVIRTCTTVCLGTPHPRFGERRGLRFVQGSRTHNLIYASNYCTNILLLDLCL